MTQPPLSLFDDQSTWLADPVLAYESFILRPSTDQAGNLRPLRASSQHIYKTRFTKFARWMVDQATAPANPQSLASISSHDLSAFFSGMSPSSKYRYVKLLERVFDHLAQLGVRQDNPARQLAIQSPTRTSQGQLVTQLLSTARQAAFLAALPEPSTPKKARDRAILCVCLGAGLSVSQLQACTTAQLGNLESDGSLPIEIPSIGAKRRHRTRCQAFAVPSVIAWKTQLSTLDIPGTLLFPADLSTGRPLSKSAIYHLVRRTLTAAGITTSEIPRRGPRLLRSTFAVQQLVAGAPLQLVGEAMGHRSDRATREYQMLAKSARQLSL